MNKGHMENETNVHFLPITASQGTMMCHPLTHTDNYKSLQNNPENVVENEHKEHVQLPPAYPMYANTNSSDARESVQYFVLEDARENVT